jgi:hypothetical protein
MSFLVPSRFLLSVAGAAVVALLTAAGIACFPGLLGLQPRIASVAQTTVAPRLSWADLSDPNTATFARNLRAIGCPEETIQRIMTRGDRVVPAPSPEVAAPVAPVAPVLPSVAATTVSAQPLATPAPVVAAAPYAAPDAVIVAPAGHVPLPVAFQSLPQDVRMTDAQRAQLNALQEQFIADIGGTNQDPNSPYYLAQWREAQRKCDAALKAIFGEGDFIRREMATARAEQAAARPGS